MQGHTANFTQPKYWCKYCSAYVKDTPLEKTNHESSPRHQGNLKRSLRDLHRSNERAERDKQYAKAEAARLNGMGSATAPLPGNGDGKFQTTVNFTRTASKPVTADDRTRQMAELAALGVVVPEGFRKENAMVGDWQTTAHKVIRDAQPEVKHEQGTDVKPGLNIGVRKRKIEEKEEVEEENVKLQEGTRRPRYGRDLRTLPEDDDDLDALLGSAMCVLKKQKTNPMDEKMEPIPAESTGERQEDQLEEPKDKPASVQQEASDESNLMPLQTENIPPEDDDVGSIFKKRKRPVKVK